MPTRPTGGPPDREGPNVVKTEPESGTTNFTGKTITFEFNEFINRGSLREALRIEPDLNLNIEEDWGRKELTIEFIDPLPDSTTVIVTLGTDLQDARNNDMAKPVTVAVSTGPTIDGGKLKATIKRAQNGRGIAGERVLLYEKPVDLSQPAIYMGESDTSGVVDFNYLAAGTYKAFWLNDKNRNRTWDRSIEKAQPFDTEFIRLGKDEADSLNTLYIISRDTLPPELQAVGLFSTRRMRMRFSENIFVTDSTTITISDTTGQPQAEAVPLYIPEESPFVLFAQSNQDLQENKFYQTDITGLVDQGENELLDNNIHFEGSAEEDTTLQRIIRFENQRGMYPEDPLIFTFATPFGNSMIADSLFGVKGDQSFSPWPTSRFVNNELHILPMDEKWEQGLTYEFRVFNPKFLQRETYEPKLWFESDFGAFEFVREDSLYQQSLVLSLRDKEDIIQRDTTFDSTAVIKRLPPLSYTVIIYQDRNENGTWDAGTVSPFKEPEPYYIRRNLKVKSGFTASVPVEFEPPR